MRGSGAASMASQLWRGSTDIVLAGTGRVAELGQRGAAFHKWPISVSIWLGVCPCLRFCSDTGGQKSRRMGRQKRWSTRVVKSGPVLMTPPSATRLTTQPLAAFSRQEAILVGNPEIGVPAALCGPTEGVEPGIVHVFAAGWVAKVVKQRIVKTGRFLAVPLDL